MPCDARTWLGLVFHVARHEDEELRHEPEMLE